MNALKLLLAIGAVAAGPVYADCSVPKAPETIPDGATAALADMVAAQKAVRAYNDEVKAYTDCLRLEQDNALAAAGEKITPEERQRIEKAQTSKNNAVVDQAQAVTTRFNEQIKIFKARPKTG